MATTAELYDQDFVRWTEEQAKALRLAAESRLNLPVDWEHLAQEVEGLGANTRRELATRIGAIIEHLLKLQHSDAVEPRRGWIDTVFRERLDVALLLDENPSLRPRLPATVASELRRRRKLTLALLDEHGDAKPGTRSAIAASDYGADQVLGDWLPPRRP